MLLLAVITRIIYVYVAAVSHRYLHVVGACAALKVKNWLGTWRSVPATYYPVHQKYNNDDTPTPSPRGYIACRCVAALDAVEGGCHSCGPLRLSSQATARSTRLSRIKTLTTGRQQRAQNPGTSPCVCVTLRTRTRTYLVRIRYTYSTWIPPKAFSRYQQDISSRQQVIILYHISDVQITYLTSYRPIYKFISPYIGQ